MSTPEIRRATADDLDDLFSICLLTGASGEDATEFYDDPKLLGNIYAAPYLVSRIGLGFVAVDDEGVSGYVVGTPFTRSFEKECEEDWWPALRVVNPDPGPDFDPTDWSARMRSLIHRPLHSPPDLLADFPAHLHINLLPRAQGQGVGKELIAMMLGAFHVAGVRGAHLGVSAGNTRAIGFYRRVGFTTLVESDQALILGVQWTGEMED
ncbi:acetyltransferase (GNAT) family protein [Nocardioides albertanoniae]|uniref:Acetyltransferase (GNAT) family protein n=1 Tax=Nocardioides albertanoniae TaxID=1175486 RepID=A0A543A6W4_9ACTN|nr:GNAT family N-acetyltransferase [Nocardioides albertanoniae]TQL68351.1 acetyltransferase (GNAT) family protein [Nocardioides albertanoniae]